MILQSKSIYSSSNILSFPISTGEILIFACFQLTDPNIGLLYTQHITVYRDISPKLLIGLHTFCTLFPITRSLILLIPIPTLLHSIHLSQLPNLSTIISSAPSTHLPTTLT
eukprot:60855_1